MTDVTSELKKIQEEEIDYNSALSEATFRKIAGSINAIVDEAVNPIGSIVTSILSEENFAAEKGYDHTEIDLTVKPWILMSGQDITGSDLYDLDGTTTVSNATGNAAFFGQKGSAHSLKEYQSAANLSHAHEVGLEATSRGGEATMMIEKNGGGNDPDYSGKYEMASAGTATYQASNVNDRANFIARASGASEMRPNTVRVNYFLKINRRV